MEVKKSKKADLENKKSLFLEIGLCLSLLLMIGVFAYGTNKKEIEEVAVEEEWTPMEQVEVTRQDIEVPSVPTPAQTMSVLSDVIQIVDNQQQIETTQVFSDFDENFAFVENVTSTVEIAGTGTPDFFMIVEDMPSFQGAQRGDASLAKFRNWVSGRIQYPAMARELGIQGTVTLSFIIETDGSLTNVEVLSNPDRLLTEEAVRVVKTSPKWEPGRQRDEPVRVKFTLPVNFQMQ